jgi:hypothetical protein
VKLWRIAWAATFATLALCCSCGAGNRPPPPPPCGKACQDATAVLAVRNAIKLMYNVTLEGKPVGMQDKMALCPLGGSAHVTGTATSNANQGTTSVELTYAFESCTYSATDTDPSQTFALTLTGSIVESGVLSAQPSTTTALQFLSASVTIQGTVYTPPIDYRADRCALDLGQNGNDVSGTLCGQMAGVTL